MLTGTLGKLDKLRGQASPALADLSAQGNEQGDTNMAVYGHHPTVEDGSSNSITPLASRRRRLSGLKSEINRRQAEILRDEIIRPINLNPLRSKTEETFERFVEDIFLPMKTEVGEWRENTAKESTREIRSHLLPELGEMKFEELPPAVLRAILKKKAQQGLGRQVLNHLRGYLTDICRSAVAEGYLGNNVAEGLKAPVKLAKSSGPKLRVTLEQYAAAWDLLGERERLCFDLVMFAGMRESEAFAVPFLAFFSSLADGYPVCSPPCIPLLENGAAARFRYRPLPRALAPHISPSPDRSAARCAGSPASAIIQPWLRSS